MNGELMVRRPRVGDFAAVLECLAAYCFQSLGNGPCADADFAADEILTVRNRICVIDMEQRSWVAQRAGAVVGFCCWDWLDEAHRQAKTVLLSVRPEARRHGAGQRLQAARQDEMRAAGACEIHTWSDDPAAVRWYCTKFGYEPIAETPIHHCLHLIRHGSRTAWGIHRGHRAFDRLTHLRLLFKPGNDTRRPDLCDRSRQY